MLELTIPSDREYFNDKTQEFIDFKGGFIKLEHSLLSLSKWESKWNKPFLGKDKKTIKEVIDYIRCMTIETDVPFELYDCLPDFVYEEVNTYINSSQTATWFNERGNNIPKKSEVITAEILYYRMIFYGIPFSCETWHLNKLQVLIKVCSIKNTSPQKGNRKEMLADRRALNEARRKQFNSKG